jgi:hypothetical protein
MGGEWKGTWVRQTCTGTGIFLIPFDQCTAVREGRLTLILRQSGESVEGGLGIETLGTVDVSGQIGRDGTVVLSGQRLDVVAGNNLMVLSNWRLVASGSSMTNSSFVFTTSYTHSPGSMVVQVLTSSLVPGSWGL